MVAAALAVSGCGGGGGGGAPTPPGGTAATQDLKAAADTALKAADAAVKAVMDDSEDAKVTDADTKVKAAEAAVMKVPAAERGDLSRRLGEIQGSLTKRKDDRMAAMKAKADMMKAEAQAVHAGIARYSGASSSDERRHAQFNDQGNSSLSATPDLGIDIGKASTMRLKPVKDLKKDLKNVMVEARLKGWTGSGWRLAKDGATYEAAVYANEYNKPGAMFRVAWKDELGNDGLLNGTGTASTGQHQKFDGFEPVAGNNRLAEVGISYRVRGSFAGVPGEYHCTPTSPGKSCAVQPRPDGLRLGESDGLGNSFVISTAAWRFRPDNVDDRVRGDRDTAFVTYGYWIKKGADGKWDVSAFHNNHRGTRPTFASLASDASVSGKATYDGGAAGVYALSDGAGTFTADAALVADFTDKSVTGTIDGFMTRGFTGGDGMSRDWSVELRKLIFSSTGESFVTDASKNAFGRTRWTMDGEAAPAAGRWEGSFYERAATGAGLRPKAATGSFFAEHGMSGRMVGAFGVTDPDTDEPLE